MLRPTVISGICFCNANKGWTDPSLKSVQASGWPCIGCCSPLVMDWPTTESWLSPIFNVSLVAFKCPFLVGLSCSWSHKNTQHSTFDVQQRYPRIELFRSFFPSVYTNIFQNSIIWQICLRYFSVLLFRFNLISSHLQTEARKEYFIIHNNIKKAVEAIKFRWVKHYQIIN